MMLFLTSLVLSCLVMTQADDDRMMDALNAQPLSDLVYVFDVTSDAPILDIKNALTAVNIRHSFKVIGEARYFLVVTSDDVQALRDISFPAGSVVTQYPSSHVGDFYRLFGYNRGFDESYDAEEIFDDVILTALYWEFRFPDDVDADEYAEMMRDLADSFREFDMTVRPATYATLSSYPPRFFFFLDVDDNALQEVHKTTLSIIGGPARLLTRIAHVTKI